MNNATGVVINYTLENNRTFGYVPQGGTVIYMTNCSFFNYTSDAIGGTIQSAMTVFQNNSITLTAATMVSPSTGNFAPNTNAGGGCLASSGGVRLGHHVPGLGGLFRNHGGFFRR